MDYTYGFPLYKMKDIKKAYNYLKYSEPDYDEIHSYDRAEYSFLSNTDSGKDKMLVTIANSQKVTNTIINILLPELSEVLKAIKQKHGIVVVKNGMITSMINPFMSNISAELYYKVLHYVHEDCRSMDSIWIYFGGFVNKDLEQLIKQKYKPYILEDKNGITYFKISPEENFCLIYDLIDDIMYYC